ncbi:uncharacterized protein LOC110848762 [Folsomia candida]|uniref:Uncharacterized protein n=1 Tax=Folsomia candida TaxID=158441 RepID=A0A226EFI4_FOLCA|nr:uncharacterized protein LOC110848762 [Folsomia candida]OXA56018.1 hypothetical protein Fcan01_08867 [Folsomia candida]
MSPFFILVLIAVSSGFVESKRDTKIKQPVLQLNGTTLTDKVMDSVRAEVIKQGWDDINPPDVVLKDPFGFSNYSLAIRNQSIKGMANAYRVGDVIVNVTILNTKFRSAFAVYNVSSDADVQIHTKDANYDNGHVHSDCDNVTAYQVFKLDHLTQTLTLDEFELSIGECNYNATGLGERAANASTVMNALFSKLKAPMLLAFNTGFKIAINAALAAARTALLG